MSNVTKNMLIKAVIFEEGRVSNVALYQASFLSDEKLDEPGAFKQRLGEAFKAWALGGPWARKFVETNGTNWCDALAIDDLTLSQHRILSYSSAVTEGPHTKLIAIHYECEIVVDHDESLFDARDIRGNLDKPDKAPQS